MTCIVYDSQIPPERRGGKGREKITGPDSISAKKAQDNGPQLGPSESNSTLLLVLG